ncbi:MAG TPA: ABC transporter ATP-binding protein [Thermoanaerobaculia bacterium]|nr:ABC transporter ATP-binding protein [Thermoanaerobaculia bacterium]
MNAVETRGIKKYFGSGETRVEALRETDFDARFGELTFVVGPSGSGKTTLLSVVAGLLDHDEGSLHVLDADMGVLSNAERLRFRRQNIGFLFQQYNLLPALTAVENVAVPLIANGIPRRPAEERAATLLETVGLGPRMQAVPSELSGGQQQRVALARALVHNPKLVICDEPTAALDHKTGDAVMALLAEHALNPERAVVVVTHDTRVLEFGDRIAYMDDGRITQIEERAAVAEVS